MLETKELVKIYKPKKGVPVTALNKISLKFPEKGINFLPMLPGGFVNLLPARLLIRQEPYGFQSIW